MHINLHLFQRQYFILVTSTHTNTLCNKAITRTEPFLSNKKQTNDMKDRASPC